MFRGDSLKNTTDTYYMFSIFVVWGSWNVLRFESKHILLIFSTKELGFIGDRVWAQLCACLVEQAKVLQGVSRSSWNPEVASCL